MQVKKHQLELDMAQRIGSKLGKEYVKAGILSSWLLNFCAEYIMWNARLDEAQTGLLGRNISNILGEISITSDMQMAPPLWQKSKRD